MCIKNVDESTGKISYNISSSLEEQYIYDLTSKSIDHLNVEKIDNVKDDLNNTKIAISDED